MPRAEDFRRVALGMADAVEGAHMGHPDFRVNNRIFATLHADNKVGMVKLTPEQQKRFIEETPAAFAPESGAWGRSGCTSVRLDAVDGDTLGEAMTLAWRNIATSIQPRMTKRTRRSSQTRRARRTEKSKR
jgi:hypothetical protein